MFSIFLPVVFMVGLTLTVLGRLPQIRVRDAKGDPGLIERGAMDGTVFSMASQKHAANLANLMQLPVLFYVAAVFAILFGATNWWTGLLAWVFVLSRAAHTAIHVRRNVVTQRFAAFLVGFVALILLWVTLIFEAGDSLVFSLDEFEERRELFQDRPAAPLLTP